MSSDAPSWPHLVREVTRHRREVWYVRVGHGKRQRLPGRPGDPAFRGAYLAAVRGDEPAKSPGPRAGSLRWLATIHMDSSYWRGLARATRRQRKNILDGVLEGAGDLDISRITAGDIVAGRERRKETPSQANNYLNTMRSLFGWAVENGHMKSDPSEGVKVVKRRTGEGFAPWSEADVKAFVEKWPTGTRQNVALVVLLTTGLRRGDAARLGPSNVVDGRWSIAAEKNGKAVSAPIHPDLAAAIELGPIGAQTFIATNAGRPMVKEAFGNWFGEACREAGVQKSAHGLRKLAATRLAHAGATEAELDAIMGWTPGSGMSRVYIRSRDDALLADRAMQKLIGNPAPQIGAGNSEKN